MFFGWTTVKALFYKPANSSNQRTLCSNHVSINIKQIYNIYHLAVGGYIMGILFFIGAIIVLNLILTLIPKEVPEPKVVKQVNLPLKKVVSDNEKNSINEMKVIKSILKKCLSSKSKAPEDIARYTCAIKFLEFHDIEGMNDAFASLHKPNIIASCSKEEIKTVHDTLIEIRELTRNRHPLTGDFS